MNKRNRRFENHLGLHHQRYDVIPDPMVPHVYSSPGLGIAREDFIEKNLGLYLKGSNFIINKNKLLRKHKKAEYSSWLK
jgi:hypothetical protein